MTTKARSLTQVTFIREVFSHLQLIASQLMSEDSMPMGWHLALAVGGAE
jgi:hypothetical protein